MLSEPKSVLLVATAPLDSTWFIGLAPESANPMNHQKSFLLDSFYQQY